MYLFPHNDKWQSEFEYEKSIILSNYESDMDVLHIGSTAVNGLYAKDCIDILGVVKDISIVHNLRCNLENIGYTSKGPYGISGREYFSKKIRKVHLHVFQSDDENIDKHLKFVKVMQNNPELIYELNQIKKELHAKFPNDKSSYQSEKNFFYNRINKML